MKQLTVLVLFALAHLSFSSSKFNLQKALTLVKDKDELDEQMIIIFGDEDDIDNQQEDVDDDIDDEQDDTDDDIDDFIDEVDDEIDETEEDVDDDKDSQEDDKDDTEEDVDYERDETEDDVDDEQDDLTDLLFLKKKQQSNIYTST